MAFEREGSLRAGSSRHSATSDGTGRFLTRRMAMMLGVIVTILVLVFGYIVGKGMLTAHFMSGMKQVVAVSTTHATPTPWQTQMQAVGSLHAVAGADLAPEVAGLVAKIGFTPGQDVKKGTLLVQLRDDSDRAALAAAQATADDAQRTYKRYAELIKTRAISQASYDTALSTMQSAVANVAAARATVEKKAIRAPFDGRVGIRQVDVGQYVAAGVTVVTLQHLDPVYADFTVAQQQLSKLHVGDNIVLKTDAVPGKSFTGKLVAFDPAVDTATRTVRVRAEVPNPDKLLLPGMFATVLVDVGGVARPLTLPQTAITYNTYGNVVFVVSKTVVDGKEQLVAQQRFITTGDTRGDQVIVLSGVTAQDEVVSAGGNKLKNGTLVSIHNDVTLPNQLNPHLIEK